MPIIAVQWDPIPMQELENYTPYLRLALRRPGEGPKFIGLLVYAGDEFYADISKNSEKIEALQSLINNLSGDKDTELNLSVTHMGIKGSSAIFGWIY